MKRPALIAALLSLGPAGAAADELSGADKLRVLYSSQFAWTREGLPLVTVRLVEGLKEVKVRGELRVLPDGEGGDYHLMMQGDRPVGGIMAMVPGLPPGTPPHWTSYLAVMDVDAACRQTRELGGGIIRAPWDVPGVGRIAIITDPTGAVLALITPVAATA